MKKISIFFCFVFLFTYSFSQDNRKINALDNISKKTHEELHNNPNYIKLKSTSLDQFLSKLVVNDIKTLFVYDEFPKGWIKKGDIDTLFTLLDSEIICKNLKNVISSHTSKNTAKLGDYAFWLIDSYRHNTLLYIGLNLTPKMRSEDDRKELKQWWKNYNK